MNISQNPPDVAIPGCPQKYDDEYVVAEDRIEELVGNLRQRDLIDMGALMLAVFVATHMQREGKLDEVALRLIRSVAAMKRGNRYRSIMEAIIGAVEQGAEGVEAARATARRAIEFAFDCTPDDAFLRSRYESLLISEKTSQNPKRKSEKKVGGRSAPDARSSTPAGDAPGRPVTSWPSVHKVWCPLCKEHVELRRVRTAAKLIDVSSRTVYRYIEQGVVHALKVAGKTRRVCTACLIRQEAQE